MSAELASLLVDAALLLTVASLLTFKGLVLRRRTPLGRAMARNNFAMAIVYLGAFLALFFEVFRSPYWRWSIRVLVAVTAYHAIWEMMAYYGGWLGVLREVQLSLDELRAGAREARQTACWQVRRWWGRLRRCGIGANGDQCE